jgi:hypothetical protein
MMSWAATFVSIGDGPTLPQLTGVLTLAMVVLAITAFAALWIYVLAIVWRASGPNPPVFNDAVQYLAPILTALIGGIVAMVFGVSIATPPHGFLESSQILLSFKPSTWIYGVYIIGYLVLGASAGVTWVAKTAVTPPLVKNFAMTTIGLVVAVVSASFGLKPQ